MIPYGRQSIDEDDIRAVCEALRSDWLTTGPRVEQFERAVAEFCGTAFGVAVASGTAALHCAMHALGIGPGDEVIVPTMTFAATANCVRYAGATPVFADVDPDTLLLPAAEVGRLATPRTRAVIAVDYAGQPCDYDSLRKICAAHNLVLVADACHALGAATGQGAVGSLADLTVFSFHPVKHITTGEGGMVMGHDKALEAKLRRFRNHGIDTEFRQRQEQGTWRYDMVELGMNYRITDIQCALGISQLTKLPGFLARRNEIAARYDQAFAGTSVRPLVAMPGALHAYHLYVVRVTRRDAIFTALRAAGIGVNVHYSPVHLHPYYRQSLGTGPGLCPVAEATSETILSLPLHPGMSDADVETVVRETLRFMGK
ncbi:MAG: UDP-4-amino-4,6-dideoxy-N-acetyl-beta-L-altrosamine transaminase [Proteobacteria bacterium]|nr:UDP-4-amino-4,6-dideoxy-N-acetyl-beta-L-altrosamine transaminase [Pseudomonadota bacterium]